MVLTLDVLLHEAGENNFKIKLIRSILVKSSTQEYLKTTTKKDSAT